MVLFMRVASLVLVASEHLREDLAPLARPLPAEAFQAPPLLRAAARSRAGAPVLEESVPWDFPRFVSQSSKFITLPSLFPSAPRAVAPGQSLGALEFFPLDDVVMGGASSSTFDNGSRRWSGDVTSQKAAAAGGFVGVRTRALEPALDLRGAAGLELRVRTAGDGAQRFKLGLRDSTDFNGVVYTASFDVGAGKLAGFLTGKVDGDGVETVRVPFSALVPTVFARTVDAELNLANVVALQVALSKFQYDGGLNSLFREGPFQIDILDIAAY